MGHNVDHPITDTKQDGYFQINPVTREISNSGDSKKLTLIKNDHNSEVFTFELPRMIEGHDMSLCNQVTVHFINMGSSKDTSENVYTIYKRNVDDPEPKEDENDQPGMLFTEERQFGFLNEDKDGNAITDPDKQVVIGTWLISRAATKYRGNLSFVVRFECLGKENISTLLFEGDILTLDNGKKVIVLANSFEYEDGTVALDSNSEEKELTLKDGKTISLDDFGVPQVVETVFPVDYSWSSAIYSKIVVADTHDNSEEALEPYHDILENWWNKICQASDTLYAITDDGVLLDVTEKVNGLQDSVQSLTETVESLQEEVTSERAVCNLSYFDGTPNTIYSSVGKIPNPQRSNGARTLVYKNGSGTPIDVYSYNGSEWVYKSTLRSNTIYCSLVNGKLYRYTNTSPYLLEVSNSDEANVYTDGAVEAAKDELDGKITDLTNTVNSLDRTVLYKHLIRVAYKIPSSVGSGYSYEHYIFRLITNSNESPRIDDDTDYLLVYGDILDMRLISNSYVSQTIEEKKVGYPMWSSSVLDSVGVDNNGVTVTEIDSFYRIDEHQNIGPVSTGELCSYNFEAHTPIKL